MEKTEGFYIMMLFILSTMWCFADTIPDVKCIEIALVKKGYENITIFTRSDTLFVDAENRLYRWYPKAYADMIEIIMPFTLRKTTVCLTILRQGIPMVMLTLPKLAWEDGMNGKLNREAFSSLLQTTLNISSGRRKEFRQTGANTFFNKIDLVVYPQVKIQLGNWDDPFKSQFNLAPAFEISFLRGMNMMAQVIIPLQNDLEPNGNTIRPGLITISQTMRFPHNFFGTVSVGYFTRNRYGINAEARKFFLNGKINLGLNGGLTGYAELIDQQWTYSTVNLFTWFADAAYRWARYDLTLKAGYGNFLNGSAGWRMDAYRQFREVTIGFFALETDGFLNGGFYFSIPLPPGKYSTQHALRIRPESYFSWEYRARGMSEAGRSYSTGNSLSDLFHNINPDYLKQNVINSLYFNFQNIEKK
ncbi:MAG: hypothetical protein WCP32_04575 [Bacteroidota bacterium]